MVSVFGSVSFPWATQRLDYTTQLKTFSRQAIGDGAEQNGMPLTSCEFLKTAGPSPCFGPLLNADSRIPNVTTLKGRSLPLTSPETIQSPNKLPPIPLKEAIPRELKDPNVEVLGPKYYTYHGFLEPSTMTFGYLDPLGI